MPECKCCQKRYSWRQIVIANLIYGKSACSRCGCDHKVTILTRLVITGMTVVPFLIFGLFLAPFQDSSLNILGGMFIFIIGLFLTPFVSKYKLVSK